MTSEDGDGKIGKDNVVNIFGQELKPDHPHFNSGAHESISDAFNAFNEVVNSRNDDEFFKNEIRISFIAGMSTAMQSIVNCKNSDGMAEIINELNALIVKTVNGINEDN